MKKRYENGGEVNNLSSEKEDEIAKTFANIKGFRGLTPEAVRQGASEGVRSQNEPREIIAERLKDSTLGAMDRLQNVRDRSLTFKEAFRQALDAGEKTFPWQGKMYTTELARSSPSAVKKETPEILPARPMTRRESDAEKARESRLGSSILKRDLFGMEPDAYIVKRRLAARDKEATPFSSSSASSQSHPEVPNVDEIRKAAAASGTGTNPISRATEGASDTIEKALAATAGGGAARLLVRNLLKSVPARAIAGAVRKEPGLFKDAIAKGKPERTLGDYKRGGSVTRGDGIAKRGKTRGRYI